MEVRKEEGKINEHCNVSHTSTMVELAVDSKEEVDKIQRYLYSSPSIEWKLRPKVPGS